MKGRPQHDLRHCRTPSICARILDETGIEPHWLSRREVLFLERLLPPGRLARRTTLVPSISSSFRGLYAAAVRLRHMLKPQGWTVLSDREVGYALVRLPEEP